MVLVGDDSADGRRVDICVQTSRWPQLRPCAVRARAARRVLRPQAPSCLEAVGAFAANLPYSVWDFLLRRDDGSAIRLQPDWKGCATEHWTHEGHLPPIEPPTNGRARSALGRCCLGRCVWPAVGRHTSRIASHLWIFGQARLGSVIPSSQCPLQTRRRCQLIKPLVDVPMVATGGRVARQQTKSDGEWVACSGQWAARAGGKESAGGLPTTRLPPRSGDANAV